MPKEYFDPLMGTRHTDPDNGLVYEPTEVKIDRQGYIVAYRRLVVRGKLAAKPDGPYHVADIEIYTELDPDKLSEAMRVGKGKASAPDTDEERGRTAIDELSGSANTAHDTSESAAESTKTRKRKRREPIQEQLIDRPRRQIKPRQFASPRTHADRAGSSSVVRRHVDQSGSRRASGTPFH
jgi:hypothetical protein